VVDFESHAKRPEPYLLLLLLLLLLLTATEFSLGGSIPYTTMNNLKNIGQSIKKKEKEFMEKVNFTRIQVWENDTALLGE
jgi:hypothetical protein